MNICTNSNKSWRSPPRRFKAWFGFQQGVTGDADISNECYRQVALLTSIGETLTARQSIQLSEAEIKGFSA
jgi:hypothetical protein